MLSLSARIEKRAGAGNSEEPLVLMGHRASPKPDTGTCEIGIESQEHEDYDRVLLFMCRYIFEGDILKMITLTGVTSLSSRNPPKRFSGGTGMLAQAEANRQSLLGRPKQGGQDRKTFSAVCPRL